MKPGTPTASLLQRRQRPQAAPALDIIVDSPLWKAQRGVKAVLQRAICEAASMATTSGGELAIVLTDDSAIRTLNRGWRGKDQPTNVLSFPARDNPSASRLAGERRGRVRLLGDIVIAYETMAREALAAHKPFLHHLAHLAVHGFLHLVGHDHATDAEADAMEALEIAVLARLDVPNPYVMRDAEA
jgi:probable rRNA maturation factor